MIPCLAYLIISLFFHIIVVVYIQAGEISTTSFSNSHANFHDNDNDISVRGNYRAPFAEDLLRNIQSAKDTEEVFSLAENVRVSFIM